MIDAHVIIDLMDPKSAFKSWAVDALADHHTPGATWVAPSAYAEIAVRQPSVRRLDDVLQELDVALLNPTSAALWRAGKAFGDYRARKGKRETILPDFMIGAQAEDIGATLITRDPRRYRIYFPDLKLIAP